MPMTMLIMVVEAAKMTTVLLMMMMMMTLMTINYYIYILHCLYMPVSVLKSQSFSTPIFTYFHVWFKKYANI